MQIDWSILSLDENITSVEFLQTSTFRSHICKFEHRLHSQRFIAIRTSAHETSDVKSETSSWQARRRFTFIKEEKALIASLLDNTAVRTDSFLIIFIDDSTFHSCSCSTFTSDSDIHFWLWHSFLTLASTCRYRYRCLLAQVYWVNCSHFLGL